MSQPSRETTRKTFRLELCRSVPVAMIEYLFIPLAGLVALHFFDASDWQKALLLAVSSLGLMASLVIVPLARKLGWELTHTAAVFNFAGAGGLALAAMFSDSLEMFLVGLGIAFFAFLLPQPLITQIYQSNFPDASRGKIFAVATMFRGLVAIVFAKLAGDWVDADLENFKPLLWIITATAVAGSFVTWMMPKVELSRGSTNPFTAFRWLRDDKKFRTLIISWMLMGLGNLISLKIWTDYFANARYGIGFSVGQVTLLTIVIPGITKLIFTYPWGWLFDHLSFYLLRVMLNICFCAAILVVFYSESFWAIAIGTGLQGFAFAGGNIAWSLWVTKLAPPEHTAEYMSIHTFMTGVRGVVAPFIGFELLKQFGSGVALFCAALIFIATVILLPEVRFGRTRRRTAPIAPREPPG